MIGDIVARVRVREDGKSIAIEREPLSHVSELISGNGELDAAARVRANGSLVKVTHGHSEPFVRRAGDGLRLPEFLRVVIEVRVKSAYR